MVAGGEHPRSGGRRSARSSGTSSSKREPQWTEDEAARKYIDAIDPGNRPLFDRVHRLILAAYPDVAVVISYQIPTYRVGRRRLHVGAWQRGVSIYGWPQGGAAGFIARRPRLRIARERSGCDRKMRPTFRTMSCSSWCAPHRIPRDKDFSL
jgi:hypothetical protein